MPFYECVKEQTDIYGHCCNMTYKNGVVQENGRTGVGVPLYKGNWEMTECKNYRNISLPSVVVKMYARF